MKKGKDIPLFQVSVGYACLKNPPTMQPLTQGGSDVRSSASRKLSLQSGSL